MATNEELLDELIRLQVLGLRQARPSQADVIFELKQAGFGPTRIADLLGTTVGTVKMALKRAKTKPRVATKKEQE